jgi:hypothetical protein
VLREVAPQSDEKCDVFVGKSARSGGSRTDIDGELGTD